MRSPLSLWQQETAANMRAIASIMREKSAGVALLNCGESESFSTTHVSNSFPLVVASRSRFMLLLAMTTRF